MRFDVIPIQSVNNLLFGTNRDEVRQAFGDFEEFKKESSNKNTADDFGFCHVFYDENNCFIAIEIFNENTVYIDGELVFPTNSKKIRELINDFVDFYGSSISLSMSVGIDSIDDDDELPESILFGKKGYYNKFF